MSFASGRTDPAMDEDCRLLVRSIPSHRRKRDCNVTVDRWFVALRGYYSQDTTQPMPRRA